MAEVLTDYDFDAEKAARRRGRNRYTAYLDGQVYKLKLGKDTRSTNPQSARNSIRVIARRHNLDIDYDIPGDGTLIVQAYTPNGDTNDSED